MSLCQEVLVCNPIRRRRSFRDAVRRVANEDFKDFDRRGDLHSYMCRASGSIQGCIGADHDCKGVMLTRTEKPSTQVHHNIRTARGVGVRTMVKYRDDSEAGKREEKNRDNSYTWG